MFGQFTIEEVYLILIFDTTNRETLIFEITMALARFDDFEMIELMNSVIKKLSQMSDEEFAAHNFELAYADEDLQEV